MPALKYGNFQISKQQTCPEIMGIHTNVGTDQQGIHPKKN
jgi:hypothetical protein